MPRGRKKGSGAAGAGSAIAGLQSAKSALVAQQDQIEKQIRSIDEIMSSLGTAATATAMSRTSHASANGHRATGKKPKGNSGHRVGSLKDMIHQTLLHAGRPMAVKDIAEQVVASGYKSKNKTLAKSVGIALLDMKSVKKVARGTYAAK
ncbi:MAG: hypothetical protein AB7N71_10220 [Phycisphaerae bacterium]